MSDKIQRRVRRLAAKIKEGDTVHHRLHGPAVVVAIRGTKAVIRLDALPDDPKVARELGRTFATYAGNLTETD